jgi:hypothetical protein
LFVLAQISVVPIVVADRSVTLLLTIGAVPVEAGVTVATAGASCSAVTSASVRFCAGGPSGRLAACGTMVMLLAIGSMRALTEFCTPWPQATSKTTAETPMMRPSMVNAERSW